MVLIDTNILVFTVLEGPQSLSVRELLRRDDLWRSEHDAIIELSSVLVMVMWVQGLEPAVAETAWTNARSLIEPGLVMVEEVDAMPVARPRWRLVRNCSESSTSSSFIFLWHQRTFPKGVTNPWYPTLSRTLRSKVVG